MFPAEYVSYHAMREDAQVELRSKWNPRGQLRTRRIQADRVGDVTIRQVHEASNICPGDRVNQRLPQSPAAKLILAGGYLHHHYAVPRQRAFLVT